MRTTPLLTLVAFLVAGCAGMHRPHSMTAFDPAEIRAAERALIRALEADDPTAWVYHYTEDAWFVEPGDPPVQGRAALLAMAGQMKPLSAVVLDAQRTEGSGSHAYTYGEASWVNGRPPNAGSASNVRVLIVWRKEADGQWRVAQEMVVPNAPDRTR